MYHTVFICLSVDVHLGCLHIMAIVNSAVMNTGLRISFQIIVFSRYIWASLVAQMVKNPPAKFETQVRSLGWEDPLEKGMAAHSSILAWKIPWTE